MAAFAIFCRFLLLVLNAAALPHRRLLPALRRRRLLRDAAAILMVLGASAIFLAVAGPNDDEDTHVLAAAGFLVWVAGVALLLLALTPGRFPEAAAAPARFAAQLVQAAVEALY
jgi:peptidoglycan/LPS O-acetylase OafA/YrhL